MTVPDDELDEAVRKRLVASDFLSIDTDDGFVFHDPDEIGIRIRAASSKQ